LYCYGLYLIILIYQKYFHTGTKNKILQSRFTDNIVNVQCDVGMNLFLNSLTFFWLHVNSKYLFFVIKLTTTVYHYSITNYNNVRYLYNGMYMFKRSLVFISFYLLLILYNSKLISLVIIKARHVFFNSVKLICINTKKLKVNLIFG